MKDTSPEIAELMRQKIMALSPEERLLMGSRMFDVARAMAIASFPPGLNEIELKRRLCERFYGDEVSVEAFVEHLKALNSDKPVKTY